ncbi:ABC transporter permease subunit [Gordonia sp. i37]|uniref:ABC transporter permease n=1 Tax=Gordonia sp. i37 TaxID=1961707 RepID=UPI001C0C5030|nr:ABC transporter permease subunit [Gordonia sp. i37]
MTVRDRGMTAGLGKSPALRRLLIAVCAAVLGAGLLVALGGPFIADRVHGGPDRTLGASYLPSSAHDPLGTDYLGRDVAARVLAGGATIVVIPLIAVILAEAVGVLAGIWFAQTRRSERLTRYLLDVVLVVPPAVSLLVVLTASGTNPLGLILLVLMISLPFVSRYAQALATPLVSSGFVAAAQARGDSTARVMVCEILPNLIVPVAADLGTRFVGAVYLVATASFLGAATLDGTANWASMVQQNAAGLALNPWSVAAPAAMIAVITIPANILADIYLERRR